MPTEIYGIRKANLTAELFTFAGVSFIYPETLSDAPEWPDLDFRGPECLNSLSRVS